MKIECIICFPLIALSLVFQETASIMDMRGAVVKVGHVVFLSFYLHFLFSNTSGISVKFNQFSA